MRFTGSFSQFLLGKIGKKKPSVLLQKATTNRQIDLVDYSLFKKSSTALAH